MKKYLFALLIMVFAVNGNAAQQNINTTSATTWGTERGKIQSNFVELYAADTANKAAALVGDCTVGPCLDGSPDGGNLIKLWAGTGTYWTALQGGAPAANRSWRLPIAAPPAAGETLVMTMDEYGQMGFIAKPSTTGYVLSSTDAGVLSWIAPGSGSMVYPGAGIPNSTGSAWGTSYTLDTDLSSVSASDDSVPSAKAVDAAYAKKTGIAFVAGALADMKILDTAQPVTGSALFDDTLDYGATDDNLHGWTIEKTGSLLAGKAPSIATEVNGSATGDLTAAQVSSTIVYNTGMGGADVALTLPTAAAGYTALFTVGTAQSFKWGVRAGTNDKIYLLAADGTISAGSDNGYARMTAAQIGQSFACWTIKTDAYDWACKAVSIGTSTFAAN